MRFFYDDICLYFLTDAFFYDDLCLYCSHRCVFSMVISVCIVFKDAFSYDDLGSGIHACSVEVHHVSLELIPCLLKKCQSNLEFIPFLGLDRMPLYLLIGKAIWSYVC